MEQKTAGLHNGARVAIIGGGVSGAAMAAALLFTARTRGKSLQVQVFEGPGNDPVGAPVILSAECRSRLAALGCRVPLQWRGVELAGIDVCRGSKVERLEVPPGALWVVDGWPARDSGRSVLSTALASAAALQGATFLPRPIDQIEHDPQADGSANAPAPFIVRARGRSERFHAVVNASGPGGLQGEQFFKGFEGAPTLPAAHARITVPALERIAAAMRIVLQPIPGVDALYLVPCKESIYAFAYGPQVTPADLCQALMACARDGHLAEAFEIAALAPTRVSCGVGKNLVADGRLTVGPAALGHPFGLTLSSALASCSRAAVAMLEAGISRSALRSRYLREGIGDLCDDARACAKANASLRKCGDEAVRVFTRGQVEDRYQAPWTAGILGMNAPTAKGLRARARQAAMLTWFKKLWGGGLPELPTPSLNVERPLFYVVDDDGAVREALSEYLETRGAEVVCFSDELALYCAVARRPPTAIVLDVVLQWVDGLSLCEGLKQHPLTRNARVVVMSGINRPFVRSRALSSGAEAFFAKPVDPELLWRRLMGVPAPAPAQPKAQPAQPAFVETGRYAS